MTNGTPAPSTDPTCPVCDGHGGYDADEADHRGEHRSRFVACENCDGTGEVDPDGYELSEWAELGRCETEASWDAPQ